MLIKVKRFVSLVLLVFLVSCGGGGGGGGSPAPVVSTSAFNILAAYINSFTTTSVNTFTVSGTASGYPVTGSGTATTGTVTSGVFEGAAALQRTTTITGSITANGQTLPLASSGIDWTDSNYIPKGSSGGSEYVVIVGTPTLPTAAHVGDTGPVYTANRYTSSTKATLLGTEVVTYVVEADTASTVLVTLISTYKNTSSTTTKTATSQIRVNTSNAYTRIKETVVDLINNQNLTITY